MAVYSPGQYPGTGGGSIRDIFPYGGKNLGGNTNQLGDPSSPDYGFSDYGMSKASQGTNGTGGSQLASYYNPFFGSPVYDISGVKSAAKNLSKGYQYNPTSYGGFNYSTPGLSTVAPRQLVGGPQPIDKTVLGDVYSQAMGAASSPVMAQSKERMRGLTQGFEGGRATGPAMQAMVLKNAQQTGSDIQDTSRNIASQLANRRLGELEQQSQGTNQEQQQQQTEMLQDRTSVRNQLFQAEQDRQAKQAQADYLKAGFTDDQARTMANGVMQANQAMSQLGLNWIQQQGNMANNANTFYNEQLNWGPKNTLIEGGGLGI